MDVITQLGALAFGSRLKRLSDRIMQDGAKVYSSQNIPFEPRWFPIFYLLSERSPLPLTEIARLLGLTHPAINQLAGDLVREGLLSSVGDKNDKRKRLLQLTEKGKSLLPRLRPLWSEIDASLQEILHTTGIDVLGAIAKIEEEFEHKTVAARVMERVKKTQIEAVEIVPYAPAYRAAFKRLNYEWLKKYFEIEEIDRRLLSDPEGAILKSGGFIFFAKWQGRVVGTCALIKHGEGVFELSKMAVTEAVQGRQIGKKLAYAAIDQARKVRAHAIILETNRKLTPAVELYKKLGFVQEPHPGASAYRRSNMYMKLTLAQ